jgi:hypothetical protein
MSNPELKTAATSAPLHGSEAVSSWVARWAHLVPADATVLDLACGLGRHAVYFSKLHHHCCPVDFTPKSRKAASSLVFGGIYDSDDSEQGCL